MSSNVVYLSKADNTSIRGALQRLVNERTAELGPQHPAVCLADAALRYQSTEACNERAMAAAFNVLDEAVR